MAIAQPGDDRWVLLDTGPDLIMSTMLFAGHFYGVTASGIVMVDMAGGRGRRLGVAAEGPKPFTFSSMMDTVHLAVRRSDMKETELVQEDKRVVSTILPFKFIL